MSGPRVLAWVRDNGNLVMHPNSEGQFTEWHQPGMYLLDAYSVLPDDATPLVRDTEVRSVQAELTEWVHRVSRALFGVPNKLTGAVEAEERIAKLRLDREAQDTEWV